MRIITRAVIAATALVALILSAKAWALPFRVAAKENETGGRRITTAAITHDAKGA